MLEQRRSEHCGSLVVGGRPEPGFKEVHEIIGDVGMRGERSSDVRLGERRVHEVPIRSVGAQYVDLPMVEIGENQETTQTIGLSFPDERCCECCADTVATRIDVEAAPIGSEHAEIMGEELVIEIIIRGQSSRNLLDHTKPEILDERQHLRQVTLAAAAVHDDPGQVFIRVGLVEDRDSDRFTAGHQCVHIDDRTRRLSEG